MMRPQLARSALTEWLQMLDIVDASITAALARIEDVENSAGDDDDGGFFDAYESQVSAISQRVLGLQARVVNAAQRTRAVEALLLEHEHQSQDWLKLAAQTRQGLTQLPANCVS